MATIQELASKIEKETYEYLNEKYPTNSLLWVADSKTRVIPGRKYTKIDVGHSGKYMVENKTGIICGIKAYGVIHKGHCYGTLETINDYFWGGYTTRKKV